MGIESNAPGYIALGRPWVYADMIGLMSSIYPGGIPDTDDSDGGTIGGVNFSYQPDSIIGYYKRTYADAGSKLAGTNLNEEAKINCLFMERYIYFHGSGYRRSIYINRLVLAVAN